MRVENFEIKEKGANNKCQRFSLSFSLFALKRRLVSYWMRMNVREWVRGFFVCCWCWIEVLSWFKGLLCEAKWSRKSIFVWNYDESSRWVYDVCVRCARVSVKLMSRKGDAGNLCVFRLYVILSNVILILSVPNGNGTSNWHYRNRERSERANYLSIATHTHKPSTQSPVAFCHHLNVLSKRKSFSQLCDIEKSRKVTESKWNSHSSCQRLPLRMMAYPMWMNVRFTSCKWNNWHHFQLAPINA